MITAKQTKTKQTASLPDRILDKLDELPTVPRTLSIAILLLLAVGGTVALVAVAPGASILLNRRRRPANWQVQRAADSLVARGDVRFQRHRGKLLLELTTQGKKRSRQLLSLAGLKIKTPKRWDGQWRIVFFDIPKSHSRVRDYVRKKLQELGFIQLQKSVYLYPYECRDTIEQMANFYRIAPYIKYARVAELPSDYSYRKHFSLLQKK